MSEYQTAARIDAVSPRAMAPASTRRPVWRPRYTSSSCARSEEHTSELQSLMRTSYAGFCLKKKKLTTMGTKKNQNNKKRNLQHEHNNHRVLHKLDNDTNTRRAHHKT